MLRNPAIQSPRPYREEQVVPGGSREGLGSRASSHLWGRALKPPDVRSWEECPHIPPALSPAATAGRPRVAAGPAHSPARGARPETGWVCSLPTWLSPLPRAPGPWPRSGLKLLQRGLWVGEEPEARWGEESGKQNLALDVPPWPPRNMHLFLPSKYSTVVPSFVASRTGAPVRL